jgi:hypothetical protein
MLKVEHQGMQKHVLCGHAVAAVVQLQYVTVCRRVCVCVCAI